MNQLRDGKYNEKKTFTLLSFDDDGKVVEVLCKGCYVLVDNGYLKWSVTVPPMKNTTSRSEIRFSEWLESLRKDVECTFGILKGRWRILKTGIRTHELLNCDRTWLTCCSLHNMLLDVDGLDEEWEQGTPSQWEAHNAPSQIPNAIEKLNNPGLVRNGDISGNGFANDYITSEPCDEIDEAEDMFEESEMKRNEDGSINVTDLPLNEFRRRLVRHFNIMFKQNKVVWPKRNDRH